MPVPHHVSARGTAIPGIIYGTAWKKDRTAGLVQQALTTGFRGIDTACQPKHYSEREVGAGVIASLSATLTREKLYLQTKFTPLSGQDPKRVPYDTQAKLAAQIRQSCSVSLENLRTNYLDALLLHSLLRPFERTLEAWRVLEELVSEGRVKELGVSNCYDVRQLDLLWDFARIKPALVQNRFYADTGYDAELRRVCRERGILYQSFWTLSANRKLLDSRPLQQLAARFSVTPAQVLFRYLTQRGVVPLTGTTSAEHMRQSLAIFEFELEAADVSQVDALLE